MNEYFTVDRIEEKNIVLETLNGEIIIIDKGEMNSIPNEGDVVIKKNNIFVIDHNETEERKVRVKKFMKGMWEE